jgi:hypothetical protein
MKKTITITITITVISTLIIIVGCSQLSGFGDIIKDIATTKHPEITPTPIVTTTPTSIPIDDTVQSPLHENIQLIYAINRLNAVITICDEHPDICKNNETVIRLSAVLSSLSQALQYITDLTSIPSNPTPIPHATETPTIIPTPTQTPTPITEPLISITNYSDYYAINTTLSNNITVEFDAHGYISGEPMVGDNDQITILVIQDVPETTNWQNWRNIDGFLFQLIKLAKYDISTDGLKLKFGSYFRLQDNEVDVKTYNGGGLVGHPLSWNPDKWYHWSVTLSTDGIQVSRDGMLIFNEQPDYRIFGNAHNPITVLIGGSPSPGFLSSKGVSYKNIHIYQ